MFSSQPMYNTYPVVDQGIAHPHMSKYRARKLAKKQGVIPSTMQQHHSKKILQQNVWGQPQHVGRFQNWRAKRMAKKQLKVVPKRKLGFFSKVGIFIAGVVGFKVLKNNL